MTLFTSIFSIAGGLCMFLYGIRVLSDGIQEAAGERLKKALDFMTQNRVAGVLTGLVVTLIVQSSSAVSVVVVSFVNAGLLTLTQAIGVIFGTNIGTTGTAWIVSLIGKFDISVLALPALVLGFVMENIKWKYKSLGSALIGFAFVFLGLEMMENGLPEVHPEQVAFVGRLSNMGFFSVIIGVLFGTVITIILNSSSATTALTITLAYSGLFDYRMACAIILGANIGTTTDAIIAAIGARPAAKQTALVHVGFNVVGTVIAVILFNPFMALMDLIDPGLLQGEKDAITIGLALFHTIFNLFSTILFLPFVKQISWFCKKVFRDDEKGSEGPPVYEFVYDEAMRKSPELVLFQAEREVQSMAGKTISMFDEIIKMIPIINNGQSNEEAVDKFIEKMHEDEEFADQMREQITLVIIRCSNDMGNSGQQRHISALLRIVADLEDMTDECFGMAKILERSEKKNLVFKEKEMEAITPFISLAKDYLQFTAKHLGAKLSFAENRQARDFEGKVNEYRDKLRKKSRKRMEAGEDVKTELLFIDLVKRIEHIGDFCYSIAKANG
ncbi:MAG: Na/Pi cotransporter family protein [Spirochaetaceae bacterium]|jgi:phosphate:Na+ symporter|nr:Na/Pi cotransporter family protein [Spirochaetaceae bacterium]